MKRKSYDRGFFFFLLDLERSRHSTARFQSAESQCTQIERATRGSAKKKKEKRIYRNCVRATVIIRLWMAMRLRGISNV